MWTQWDWLYAPAGQLHLAAHVLEALDDTPLKVLVQVVKVQDHLHVGATIAQLLLQLLPRELRIAQLFELIARQLGDHQRPFQLEVGRRVIGTLCKSPKARA